MIYLKVKKNDKCGKSDVKSDALETSKLNLFIHKGKIEWQNSVRENVA